MSKFPTKVLALFLLSLIALVGIFSVLGNIFLAEIIKQKIPVPIPLFDNTSVVPTKIVYAFPNSIVLRNLTLQTTRAQNNITVITVPTTTLKFSILDLLRNKRLGLSSITFNAASCDLVQFQNFLQKNFVQIQTFLENLPKKNITLILHKGRAVMLGKEQLTADLRIIFKGNSFSSQGTFSKQKGAVAMDSPLNYEMKGLLTDDGFIVDNFTLNQRNVYSNFWGERHGSRLELNGFCFIENEKPMIKPAEKTASILRKIRAFRQQRTATTTNTGGLYILDINGNFNFEPTLLQISNLEFTLNNIPVQLKGQVAFKEKAETQLTLSVFPPATIGATSSSFKRADFQFTGGLDNADLKTDGSFKIDFNTAADNAVFPQQVTGHLKAMDVFIDLKSRLALSIGTIDVLWGQKIPTEHRLSFKDFSATFNFLADRVKILEFQSPFETEGAIKGKLWMDTGQLPTKTTATVLLENIQSERLQDLLVYFSKIHGYLNGQLTFENPPARLQGKLWIKNGSLLDFDFFKWLAESFAVPALHKIDFERLSSFFVLDQQGVQLNQLDLQSPDVKFNGHFQLDRNNLIASKLSVVFSRGLLESSGKTRPILRLFNDDISSVLFDFQLSGNPDMVNFQWLDNDAKQKIQAAIPNFIQRRIEKNIDQTMDASDNAKPQ